MVAERGVWPPQERTPEKTCEQVVDLRVRQVVEQVLAVPKNSSQDRNLQGTVEQIPDDPMLGKAEQLVEVPETVSRDGVQQRTVEQIVDAPVPQAVEELSEVSKVFSQGRIQQRIVEQTIPAIPLAEKIVELPVIQTEERTQQGVNTHAQHVVNTVEVEKPKIIELTVQRKKYNIQEKINQVTRHVEIPVLQIVEKTVETSEILLQFTEVVVDTPVVAQRQIPIVVQTVQTNMEIPQLHYCGEVIDVPVVLVVQAPLVQIMMKTVQISQLPFIEKIYVIPEIRTVPGTQTSESLNTAFLRRVTQAEIGASSGMQRSTQQRDSSQAVASNNCKQHNKREKTEEEKKEEGKRKKGGRGKEEERDAEEQECKQVKKDATGWTVVTRNKRQRKMVQVFVKVDGGKTSTMEVKMSDRVDDIVKRTPISDQDVYVTSGGRTLRRSDKLESCEVRDGSTVEITSRMRGGGRHKDKKSKVEKKQGMKQEPLKNGGPAILESEKEAVIRMLEETEEYRKIVDDVSGGSDVDMEWKMRYWASKLRERPGADILECGLRWAVEARRKGRDKQGGKTEQEQSKQGKQVRFGEEQQLGKTGAENAGEPEVMDETTEVRTGRGSTGLVRGGDERCRADETSKGKGKGNGGKGEHEGKGGGFGHSGKQQGMREREEERVRMAPNMGAGGSHPQATSDPGEREMAEEKETRGMRWADCEDDEGKEEEEREQETEEAESKKEQEAERKLEQEQEQEGDRKKEAEEKKEQEEGARQREMTDERPPGLEEVESEPKTQGEEQSQVESKQEAQEKASGRAREQKRAQEAREDEESRAQEAREEERRVQEAHEEERRAQEAREEQKRAQKAREEERRAQEAQEEERRAQEAREEQRRAQEAREKETRAQEEQAREKRKAQEEQEEEREVEAQEGHEEAKEVTTQEKCVEAKKENSMHDENDVSNRHMTWWQKRMVDPCGQWTSPADGPRPSTSLASSQKSSARSARDRTGRRGRKGEMGAKGQRGEKKATHCTLSSISQATEM